MKVTNNLYYVKDVASSVDFYEKLGFSKSSNGGDAWAEVKLGDFFITLVATSNSNGEEFLQDEQAGNKGLGMYLYVQTEDVDQTYRDLLAKNVTIKHEPRDWPWGNREFVVKDPDGYKTVFWAPLHK